ncbi:uncharacterized protein LOC130815608 [Amaranthus tricolor]|uniref:uncharacterized protein LOC130815608 n=1 Tax=Amaranthus tricolor TaxID=29722 RepID=UPI00258E43F9|nr:uncharacterized protein LOC130815608 [Amaranthus tricolor]
MSTLLAITFDRKIALTQGVRLLLDFKSFPTAPTVPKMFEDLLSDKHGGTITVPKLGDPGDFSIPVTIGGVLINKALCDLGVVVSLIPYSLYKKLGNVGELAPYETKLQLADYSLSTLRRF